MPAGGTALDFGCGTGLDAAEYVRRGCRVLAHDVSGGMMAELNPRCHENIRAGRILTSHGAHSPSSSSRTGLIQMRLRPTFAVLNMIEDLRPIFDGFAARLAPQGWAIVSLLNPLSWRKVSTVWLRSARDITLSEHTFRLFRACLSTNDCLGSVERWPYYAFERWRTWRHQQRSPHNFRMTVPDLHALFVFYACPSPSYS